MVLGTLTVVPPVAEVGRAVEAGVLRVPSEAAAELERAVYDRGLLKGRLLQSQREGVRMEKELSAALWRAADAEVDAAEVARARAVLRRHARFAVARERAERPEPPLWRDWLGLALLALLVLWGWVREAVIAVIGGLALAFGLVAAITLLLSPFV